jgi:hypothetical protein
MHFILDNVSTGFSRRYVHGHVPRRTGISQKVMSKEMHFILGPVPAGFSRRYVHGHVPGRTLRRILSS